MTEEPSSLDCEEPPDSCALVRVSDYRRWYAEEVLRSVFSVVEDQKLIHSIFLRFHEHPDLIEQFRFGSPENNRRYSAFYKGYAKSLIEALRGRLYGNHFSALHQSIDGFFTEMIEPALHALYVEKYER